MRSFPPAIEVARSGTERSDVSERVPGVGPDLGAAELARSQTGGDLRLAGGAFGQFGANLPVGDSVLEVAVTEPSTLDPMRIQDPGSVLIARQLFEGLTAWDPIAEEVVPAAAESWKLISFWADVLTR